MGIFLHNGHACFAILGNYQGILVDQLHFQGMECSSLKLRLKLNYSFLIELLHFANSSFYTKSEDLVCLLYFRGCNDRYVCTPRRDIDTEFQEILVKGKGVVIDCST